MTSPSDWEQRSRALGESLSAVALELDWEFLGTTYCHEGGESFFTEESSELLIQAGLEFSEDIGLALDRVGPVAGGSSLYVGAALFELVPVLFETLILDRRVTILNLDSPEARELNRALEVVERQLERPHPRVTTGGFPAVAEGLSDHVWMTSVLTDPEAFPTLHDELYQREGTDLAVGGGNAERERKEARLLLSRCLDRVSTPCVFTTTDEELGLLELACAQRGLQLKIPEQARLSGIVGDPVRHCLLG